MALLLPQKHFYIANVIQSVEGDVTLFTVEFFLSFSFTSLNICCVYHQGFSNPVLERCLKLHMDCAYFSYCLLVRCSLLEKDP